MDALLSVLAAHRRRIRTARAADAALRGAFYVSVAATLGVVVSKFAGLSLPTAAGVAALAALPVAMVVREWLRAFSLRDCAIHLDRLLGLDERLSTAVELPGAMGQLQQVDAAVSLTRATVPPHRLPREGRLLAGSALLLAALVAIPSPERSVGKGDPAFEAVVAEEAARLAALSGTEVRFKEVSALLSQGKTEEALASIAALRAMLEQKLLDGAGGSGADLQKQLDQLAASTAAISAELARLGRPVHAPPPAAAQAKLERQKASADRATATADAAPPTAVAAASQTPWSSRYDPVIRKYFSGR